MTHEPTAQQGIEMIELVNQTHAWFDSMQIAGLSENVIVTAIQHAVIERLLRAGGSAKAAEYLQSRADVVHAFGNDLLAEFERRKH